MENKVTCVCDLCSLGRPQDKQCYVGTKKCLKKGVYTEFRNREAEEKDKALDKACGKLEEICQQIDELCPYMKYGFTPSCCSSSFCKGNNKECWKGLAEHG